ncbi:MAG: hypothetical protein L6R41_007679 [Letrouitia leprolyta]|nr:MAG: hypothetical protein L6R41_007679 [Letrouitia leprolyta]
MAAIWGSGFPLDEQGNEEPGIEGELIRVGCSGRVLDSRQGPGRWTWTATGDEIEPVTTYYRIEAVGASYIRLPQKLPPDGMFQAAAHVEGVRALAWGGGYWRADAAVKWDVLPPPNDNVEWAFRPSTPRKAHRDIRIPEKGRVLARSPTIMVYPDIVAINGTEYLADGEGSLIYTNVTTGKTLNLTTWFT